MCKWKLASRCVCVLYTSVSTKRIKVIEQLVRKESDMSPPPPSLPLSPLQLRAATATIRPHFVTSLKSLDVLRRLLTEHTSGASSWVRANTHVHNSGVLFLSFGQKNPFYLS